MSKITLNRDQKDAVEYFGDRPLLIEAGPGSGKTRVIIERVKFLINEKNIAPESLLVITFSNKAAKELMDRLVDSENGLDKEIVNKMQISTIHSFCHILLSEYGISFDILDGEESNNMFIYKNLKDLGFVDEKTFEKRHTPQLVSKFNELTSFKVDIDEFEKYVYDNFPTSEEYLDFITQTQENDEDEYFTFPKQDVKDNFKDDWYNARYQQICESYRLYLKFLKEKTLIDYALLQTTALELLESTPNLRNELKYKNILIDEFQDTDPVQMKIFDILIKNAKTFTVVGDDEQSIYAFRGSSVRFFNEFKKESKNGETEVVVLKTNYRSTESIVSFTENFIKEDRDSDSTKSLYANPGHEGPEDSIYHLYNQDREDESHNIVELIKFLKEENKISSFNDVGILSRAISGGKISSLVKKLKEEDIPYEVVGNHDLLEKDEIKSILLLFYYLVESDDKPYIMNKWNSDWLNIYGFSSKAFNALKMINLSENTRNILLELEDAYEKKVIETEKEVYKEFTGKNSRIQKFKGIFNRDEEILIEIFKRVEKPFLWKYDTEVLKEIGITDEKDLKFFNELYNLRKKLENDRNNEDVKYENKFTLLEIFYHLLNITGYLNTEFVEDELNFEELANLGIISNTLYNLEDVVTRTNFHTMFWYIYYNIENYDSKTSNQDDKVQIMTVHKSKGLEFPVVIVYGLQKDVFPSKFRNDELKLTGLMGVPLFPVPNKFAEYRDNLSLEEKERQDYLEERRILYVAMTRAEDILIISTRLDKDGNLPEIEGINFNPISLPEISDDFSILPNTQCVKREEDKEVLSLSYTSLSNYKTCPFKYHLKHDLSFVEPETIFIKKGHLVHKFLDRIHQKVKNNEDINLDEMFETHTTENERETNKKEIENIYKYVEKDLKGLTVLESELPFQIEEGDYIIEGKIDLIYEKDGKIGIMDFKTTSRHDEEDAKQQLYIYLMALRENPNYADKIDELGIYLVNSQKIKKYEIDEEYLKNLQKDIHEIVQEINTKNKFYRKRGTHCKDCTFNFICDNESINKNTSNETTNKSESKNQGSKHKTNHETSHKVNYGANHNAIDKLITPDKVKIAEEERKHDEEKLKQEKEKLKHEKEQLEKEELEKEKERLKRKKEQLKKEKEQLEAEELENEKLVKEKRKLKKEKEKLELEKLEKEKQRLERERERQRKEELEKEKEEKKRLEKEKLEKERERLKKEKLEKEREKERLEKEAIKDGFYENITSLQSYEKQIKELESVYKVKEKLALEEIKKQFSEKEITYDRFIEAIANYNQIFYNQQKSVLNIVKVASENLEKLNLEDLNLETWKTIVGTTGHIEQFDEKVKKRLDTIKTVLKQLDDLIYEFSIKSGEESYSGEIDDVLEDLEKLIESVKEY